MTHTISTKSLAEVVQPIVDFLNADHPSTIDDYYVGEFGQYGQVEEPFNEVSIDLNISDDTPESTKRVIVTLLRRSGSNLLWSALDPSHLAAEDDPHKAPLRFAIVKRAFHMETHLQWLVYLVIDHRGDEFDAEVAARQVALLVSHLKDPANLVEFGAEERSIF